MIVQADARNIPLADGSVQCVVTSPPYWGLRDYGVAGQIGLETTPEAFVATMVQVFREVKRVLRDDGTLWLNLGDSYAHNGACGGGSPDGPRKPRETDRAKQEQMKYRVPDGLKPKDLCGMPWRVAFALQADGWYLRSDIIWAKPNPMPESVTDRPTRSHEYLFLLAKSERYFYDADAIREEGSGLNGGGFSRSYAEAQPNHGGMRLERPEVSGRNKRDVWTVNSEPTPEAHFATFPQRLIEPCILAGTSEKGCCAECGAPRVRVTESEFVKLANRRPTRKAVQPGADMADINSHNAMGYNRVTTTGWQPSCTHDAASIPCVVFDPFLGSGTVGKVCERLGRRWAGLELSGDYISIARKRTSQMGLFSGVTE
jgi:DNA modification methylase